MTMDQPFTVKDASELLSPSLLIERNLLRRNLKQMVALARGVGRLRPHVKTHKMAEVLRLAARQGITKHKCATIAEAEMVASAGGTDALLAYPLVGPNVARFARLARAYPATTFRAVVDQPEGARALSQALQNGGRTLPVLVDLDVGTGRTGIDPGDAAFELCTLVSRLPNLSFDGLHAYDGHVHDTELEARRASMRPGLEQTLALRERLLAAGLPVERLVMGGTPTFPIYAALDVPGVECSPGTCILHDAGYAARYPDLPFVPAAALLTRVVSRPRPGRLCLDLGYKAVASDPPAGARVTLPGLPGATFGNQNEEHLIVETPHADDFPPGTALLAVPTHICPTCALHRRVYVIEDGQLVDEWEVSARDRKLGV
jgi:D-serine deaminase-like pyridoxal phosphate-dependent protein